MPIAFVVGESDVMMGALNVERSELDLVPKKLVKNCSHLIAFGVRDDIHQRNAKVEECVERKLVPPFV